MKYDITDNFGYDKDYKYLEEVIDITFKKEQIIDPIFSIIFVNEEEIKNINQEFRNKNSVTDVISFALEDTTNVLPKNFRVLGDIYICIPRMKEQAFTYGHSEQRELSFLTVHGLLHLLGYDHMNKRDEKIMFAKQELILNEAGIKR